MAMQRFSRFIGALAALTLGFGAAQAQEVTLRLHQFLPPQGAVPRLILDVWADAVERDSDGRIRIERFASMSLGGTPAELMDQAIDGIADIVWTANGYTPGRFPRTEVFELPFFVSDAAAASSALWRMYDEHMREADFEELHVLGIWVHGPGLFHTRRPVRVPEDLRGMKIRGGSRAVNDYLDLVGAEALGLPVTAVPEALSRGVIDGTTVPWEVTPSVRVAELVENHTEFEGPGLYTLTFTLAMNRDVYARLPEDLRDVIDRNSGHDFSVNAGRIQEEADAPARRFALDRGNTFILIPEAEAREWAAMAEPLYARWVEDMAGRGIDGQALIDQARALMEAHTDP